MEQRNRNTAMMLIAAGLFLLTGTLIGYFTVTAFVILGMAVYKIRAGEKKSGWLLVVIGGVMLLNDLTVLFVAVLFIVLGVYGMRSRKTVDKRDKSYERRQNVLQSIKWNKEPWELRNMYISSVIGEIYLDFSLALTDRKESEIVLQGIVGDVDIIVPEDIGVSVQSSVLIGQTAVGGEKEAGLGNKFSWKSPHFEDSDTKVKLVISYLVGDINIRIL